MADDGAVYASGPQLFAISNTGREQWHIDIGNKAGYTTAVVAGGTIYLKVDDFYCAFSPRGELKWKAEAAWARPGLPVITKERASILSTDYSDGGSPAVVKVSESGQNRGNTPWEPGCFKTPCWCERTAFGWPLDDPCTWSMKEVERSSGGRRRPWNFDAVLWLWTRRKLCLD